MTPAITERDEKLVSEVYEMMLDGATAEQIVDRLNISRFEFDGIRAQVQAEQADTLLNTPPEQIFAQYFLGMGFSLRQLQLIIQNSTVLARDKIAAIRAYSQIWSEIVKTGRDLGAIRPVVTKDNAFEQHLADDDLKNAILEMGNLAAVLHTDGRNLLNIDPGPLHFEDAPNKA